MKADRFVQGAACAIAVIVKGHGQSVMTEEAMKLFGLTSRAAAEKLGVDEYDLEVLWPTPNALTEKMKADKEIIAKKMSEVKVGTPMHIEPVPHRPNCECDWCFTPWRP